MCTSQNTLGRSVHCGASEPSMDFCISNRAAFDLIPTREGRDLTHRSVAGVLGLASGVPDSGGHHARLPLERQLHAPETPACAPHTACLAMRFGKQSCANRRNSRPGCSVSWLPQHVLSVWLSDSVSQLRGGVPPAKHYRSPPQVFARYAVPGKLHMSARVMPWSGAADAGMTPYLQRWPKAECFPPEATAPAVGSRRTGQRSGRHASKHAEGRRRGVDGQDINRGGEDSVSTMTLLRELPMVTAVNVEVARL